MISFGVQTFTVRRVQKRSIRKALLPLIELGIKSFEIARISFNEKNACELKELVSEQGIEICSVQVKPKYVFGKPEKIIKFCKTVGCKRVVISMLPFGCILGGEDRFYEFLDTLDSTYELYERAGVTLAYHHHNWEYITLSSGKTRMQELLARTEKIKLVHDTYWTARSGRTPAEQIREFGDRLLGIHLRDLTFKSKGLEVKSVDCAVGDGVIDFEATLRSALDVGCAYYVIEQNTDSPYTEIEKSFKCLGEIASRLDAQE